MTQISGFPLSCCTTRDPSRRDSLKKRRRGQDGDTTSLKPSGDSLPQTEVRHVTHLPHPVGTGRPGRPRLSVVPRDGTGFAALQSTGTNGVIMKRRFTPVPLSTLSVQYQRFPPFLWITTVNN